MKVTIIHKEGCPLCEVAIREFADDGHEVELYGDIMNVMDIDRRASLMTDLLLGGGDRRALPIVFVCDRFVRWEPKTGRGRVTSDF